MRLLLILSFLFGTLSIAHADTHNNSVVNEIVDRGALRVGFSSFVPWAMRSKDGEFIGFEIDVAKEVAKDMGVELELIPTA
nr:transporter substrate-binding domain-containing protein [Pseudomonadota bacterium]